LQILQTSARTSFAGSALYLSFIRSSRSNPHTSVRYLIPFWLVAILLIVVAVCCKIMYAM
jgi:hypothetical protein